MPPQKLTKAKAAAEVEALIERWKGFGYKVAAKWWRMSRRRPLDDFRAAAIRGLYEAARRFDPSLGRSFSTYAAYIVDRECRDIIVESFGVGKKHWDDPVLRERAIGTGSLSASTVDDGDRTVADSIPARPEAELAEIPPDFWDKVRGSLTPEQYRVVVLRFRDGLNHTETARSLRMRISEVDELETAALRLLRTPELARLASEM